MFYCNPLAFSMIQRMFPIWFLVCPHFLNPAWTLESFIHVMLKPNLEAFERDLTSMGEECKKCKEAKWLSEEALQTAKETREAKKQGRKGKVHPSKCRVPEISRRDKNVLLNKKMQRNRGKQQKGKTRDLFKKNGTPLQHFCLENPMDGGAW